jgi:hypothetical protein
MSWLNVSSLASERDFSLQIMMALLWQAYALFVSRQEEREKSSVRNESFDN